MLVRDSEGRLIIISRKDCKNENVYNEKIYNIRLNYTKKYKSVLINPPKDVPKELISKDFADD
jgi:hypothetical protein